MSKKYEIIMNKKLQDAIFCKDNKREPISNWHHIIFISGLVKSESEYYKVMRHDGKEAIFHKDNKDNPVSNWHRFIFTSGLVKGESEYYLVRNNNQSAIYHIHDKNNPVSNWHSIISIAGLIEGESDYYMAIHEKDKWGVFHKDNKDSHVSSCNKKIYTNTVAKKEGKSNNKGGAMEATHKISATYYPYRNSIELTWVDIDTEERASLTVQVDKKTGEAISRVVPPCVCCGAVLKKDIKRIA